MRNITMALFLALGCAPAFGATDPLRGVYAGDMDRGVDPCDDFYDYANGARRWGRSTSSAIFLRPPRPACGRW